VDALDAFEIVQVACGMGHTLALTVDGQLLSWGLGNRGQLGQGLEALSLTGANPKPKFIRELNKHKIVQIASGEAHCLALNDKGAVFAWGDSVHGQLGLGTFSTEHTPKRVMGLVGVPVTRIVCGGTHSIAISVSGDVYVWGYFYLFTFTALLQAINSLLIHTRSLVRCTETTSLGRSDAEMTRKNCARHSSNLCTASE